MVDIATDDAEGLSRISDLPLLKVVVMRIARRISVAGVLERIANSQYQTELLLYLPHVYGSSSQELWPIADWLINDEGNSFDDDQYRLFANLYWTTCIWEHITHKAYRTAYKAIHKAFCGISSGEDFLDILWTPPTPGTVLELPATAECLRTIVHELHVAMFGDRLGHIHTLAAAGSELRFGFGSHEPNGLPLAFALGWYRELSVDPTDPAKGLQSEWGFPALELISIAKSLAPTKKTCGGKGHPADLAFTH